MRLYNALTVWLHRHPEDRALLDLPTKSECVDGLIASAMSHGSIVDQLAEGGSADRAKALERLAKNMANRANRARLER